MNDEEEDENMMGEDEENEKEGGDIEYLNL